MHHIVPWATCQAHEYENLIALCPNCHRRADRGEIDRKALRIYKFNLRTAHDKFSQLEMDVMAVLGQAPGNAIQWPPFNRILLLRIIDAGYIEVIEPQGVIEISGMRMSPDVVRLTRKGIEFLMSLSTDHGD